MSTVTFLGPRIDYADRALRECGDEKTWPAQFRPGRARAILSLLKGRCRSRREARFALTWARDSLTEALGDYYTLLAGANDLSSEEEEDALAVAEAQAFDAAIALRKRLAEYEAREDAHTRGEAA